MKLGVVLLGAVLIACGGTQYDSVSQQTYATNGYSDCHQHLDGKGHEHHHGYGWGHHKCKKDGPKCFEEVEVCEWNECKKEFECETVIKEVECPPPPPVDAGLPEDAGKTSCDSGSKSEPDTSQPEPDMEPPLEADSGVPQEEDCGCPGSNEDSGLTKKVTPDAGPVPQDPEEDEGVALAGGCSMGGTTSKTSVGTYMLIFSILILLAIRVRMKIAWTTLYSKVLTVFTVAVLAISIPSAVYGFPTQSFKPATSTSDVFQTESARVSLTSVKLLYHYENDPLRVIRKPGNSTLNYMLEDRHNLNLLMALRLSDEVQLGLDLPFVANQNGPSGEDGGIGDLRLLGKMKFYTKDTLDLALGFELSLPTSTVDFVGERWGAVAPKFLLSYGAGPVDFSTNLGFRLRDTNLETKQQFTASVGARVHVVEGLDFLSDLHTAVALHGLTEERVPLEWLNGLSAQLPAGFAATAGVGVGLTRGVGVPEYRVLAGLSWSHRPKVCKTCKTKTVMIPVLIRLPGKKITVYRDRLVTPPIHFNFDKATLKKSAIPILDEVVKVLRYHKSIKRVEIQGHTDERGRDLYNMKLSEQRAQTVLWYLIDKGINPTRLTASWFGERNPVVKGAKTEADHQRNRRVEFHHKKK